MSLQKVVTDDLEAMLNALPPRALEPLRHHPSLHDLLEIILDLGRPVEARFPGADAMLSPIEVSQQDIDYVVSRIGAFGDDNRAGIERTLHRISAIRNRQERIVGLTCRVGRAVYGTIRIIQDLIESGKSVLLLGRPGVGKTTMLREVARVLADDFKKRVIIVDTSNEIAGDGDIPHPAIGHARRMQVRTPTMQHAVMIEAVENHMPEVIIIDEIGTELEALAARTIAERGVQLVATAHGNTLNNLIMNPTLSDLVGGVQTVTLSDEEAKRRGTQKTILERKAPPTFNMLVEIQDWERVTVHPDVGEAVDAILRGQHPSGEVRWLDENAEVRKEEAPIATEERQVRRFPFKEGKVMRVYPFGVSRERLESAARELHTPIEIINDLDGANLVLTSKKYFRSKTKKVKDAEAAGIPIYVLRSNTLQQMKQFLHSIFPREKEDAVKSALREAEDAITQIESGESTIDLSPQSAYIRRLQHLLAEEHSLSSRSLGKEPDRHVTIFKDDSRF
ncbi:MAG: AAA family ATPase [Chloroflexi bacterium]|nr:AAA family ATPase [Chloroflexota bacterium]